jgi:uncharacterized RDD family membrane protein YckC
MASEAAVLDPFRLPDDDFPVVPGLPKQYAGYASVTRRAVALLIDYLILLVLCTGLGHGLQYVGRQNQMQEDAIGGLIAIAFLLLGLTYFAGMESSALHATPGKLAVGLRVTDRRGRAIGLARGIGRFLGKMVSVLLLGTGFLLAPFLPKKQTLHDLLVGTLVVRLK